MLRKALPSLTTPLHFEFISEMDVLCILFQSRSETIIEGLFGVFLVGGGGGVRGIFFYLLLCNNTDDGERKKIFIQNNINISRAGALHQSKLAYWQNCKNDYLHCQSQHFVFQVEIPL